MYRLLLAVTAISTATLVECESNWKLHYGIPPYTEYSGQIKAAENVVQGLLPDPPVTGSVGVHDVTDPRYHYVLLVATVLDIAKAVDANSSLSYDNYYMEGVLNGLIKGWTEPSLVVKEVFTEITKVKRTIRPILDIVDKCVDPPHFDCDMEVQKHVNQDPKLLVPAKLLELAGQCAEIYLTETYQKEAEKHKIETLLVDGKEKLRILISKAMAVKNMVNLL